MPSRLILSFRYFTLQKEKKSKMVLSRGTQDKNVNANIQDEIFRNVYLQPFFPFFAVKCVTACLLKVPNSNTGAIGGLQVHASFKVTCWSQAEKPINHLKNIRSS